MTAIEQGGFAAWRRLGAPSWNRAAMIEALLPWLVPIGLIILWQCGSWFGLIKPRTLPSPLAIIQAGYAVTISGELFTNLGISGRRALIGLLIGGSLGFILGLMTATLPLLEKLLDTTVQMIRNIPHLALVPMVIIWFGIDESAKIFLVSLGVFFPIYVNTFHGIRTVDPDLVEMARVYGLNRWQLFRRVLLPGALPSILVGLRYALGIMWLTLIVAETVSVSSGIGYMTMNAREFYQTDLVVFGILVYALLGKLADSATRLIERRALVWHPAYAATPRPSST